MLIEIYLMKLISVDLSGSVCGSKTVYIYCAQDRDENRPGLCQSGSEGVFRQRSRRSGEDDGEPATGSVHTRALAAQRSHADHKLHHHRSAARPLIAVRTHRTEPVRRGSHT